MPDWEKREDNRSRSTHLLLLCYQSAAACIRRWFPTSKVAKIQFTEHNNGAHLKIGNIDFWPGTGLFKDKDTAFQGRGVENLIKYLKEKHPADTFVMTNREHECPYCGKPLTVTLQTK